MLMNEVYCNLPNNFNEVQPYIIEDISIMKSKFFDEDIKIYF